MEFNEKLQELRKQKGITQEELAKALFVSRTAVSKWESGRGYPNIDSLKSIAKFFGITVDELLSGDELLTLAEEDTRQNKSRFRDLLFGLLDLSVVSFLFLPFFGVQSNGKVLAVSLLSLTEIEPYLKIGYYLFVASIVLWGVLTLSLKGCRKTAWVRAKSVVSLLLGALGAILFIASLQPYAATFLFIFLMIKALVLINRR